MSTSQPNALTLRPEVADDVGMITEITRAAFRDHPHSDQSEARIIESLRSAGALTVSLVAEIDGLPVGHIAFSPISISDGSRDWYGLGPMAVRPETQGQGIGQALVRQGLESIRRLGARGCVLLGEPGFYGRFGFRNQPDLTFGDLPQEYFLCLPFGGQRATGEVQYHSAFAGA